MNIKGVIFDLDGLVFDSEVHSRNCFEKACHQLGLEYDDEWFKSLIGVVRTDYIGKGVSRYGEEGFRNLEDTYREIFESGYYKGEVPLKPGAYELINMLNNASVPICLATSSSVFHVQISFENSPFGRVPFNKMVTSDDGTASKPDPEVFLLAAKKLGLPAENCLVLEDSLNGMRAAIAAGSISCMVPDLLPPDDFIRENATFIKKDLFEVIDILRSSAGL